MDVHVRNYVCPKSIDCLDKPLQGSRLLWPAHVIYCHMHHSCSYIPSTVMGVTVSNNIVVFCTWKPIYIPGVQAVCVNPYHNNASQLNEYLVCYNYKLCL